MKTLSKRLNPPDHPKPIEKFLNALNALLKGIKRGLKALAGRPGIRPQKPMRSRRNPPARSPSRLPSRTDTRRKGRRNR